MKKIFIPILIIIILIILYNLWANSDRKTGALETHTGLLVVNQHKNTLKTGNLLAIQPYMLPKDYQSTKAFSGKMEYYFIEAKSRNWLHQNTIVVLPEHIGSALLAAGEKRSIYNSKTINEVQNLMIESNIFSFLKAYLSSTARNKIIEALFRMKAQKMAKIYGDCFSYLAKKYQLTIIGGSIVLPNPEVKGNTIIPRKGKLYNVSFLFRADGSIDKNPVIKVYPTKKEQDFLFAGKAENLPVFNTPAGKLGIILGSDSWFSKPYKHLQDKACKLIVAPSFMSPQGLLKSKWAGQIRHPYINKIDSKDTNNITVRQACEKYAMPGKFRAYNFKAGVTVFMRGKLWNISTDGLGYSFVNKSLYRDEILNTSILTNINF